MSGFDILPERYSSANLRRVLTDPALLRSELANLKETAVGAIRHTPHRTVGKHLFEREYGSGLDVMDRDWDNLLLLDACRYDVFAEQNEITGELSAVVSSGSHSDEFIIENYHDRELHDTVYISANPHTDKTLEQTVFHDVIRTYEEMHWTHRDFKSYHPRAVSEVALANYDEFSDKRLIVHFMQPHAPYIGSFAARVRQKLNDGGVQFSNAPNDAPSESDDVVRNLLDAARMGYISNEVLQQCYVENLEIVLAEVQRLIEHFDGKSVLTADHGELLGRPNRSLFAPESYGHPRKTFLPETRVVPWLDVESETRRTIVAEEPVEAADVPEEQVDEQLEALGYT